MALPQISGLALKLEQCLQSLKQLEETIPVLGTFAPQFKGFLQCLSACLPDIQKVMSSPCSRPQRAKMWLCLSQMIKTLRLVGSYSQSRQTVWYLSERLKCCVSELSQLSVGGVDSGCSEPLESFVQLMDSAIQLLESEGGPPLSCWKEVIHSLVCQAVTIARVASQTDCSEINSACQKLLLESSEVTEGTALSSLLTEVLSHSLNTLEHRVNTAVLRLLVEVFCEPNKPLKQLVSECRVSEKAPGPHSLSDLDGLVTVLDTHVERLMLVGQYTVSCCESTSRKAKMKCSLASLESVDNYLVPAVTAFYLEPDCSDKRSLVKMLCDHWQEEVSSLHSQVDHIIDSQAFTKVIESCMKELVELERPSSVKDVVNLGLLLHKHLSCAPDSPISVKHLQIFKEALHRCESRSLTHQTGPQDVASRTKEVMWLVEYFSEYLEKFYHSQISEGTINYSKNCTSDRDSNLSIRKSNTGADPETPKKKDMNELTPCKRGTDFLTPYLTRVGERSTTLYVRTPRQLVHTRMMGDRSLADPDPAAWDSLSVDVSEILDNLSKLADTLSSEREDSACRTQEDSACRAQEDSVCQTKQEDSACRSQQEDSVCQTKQEHSACRSQQEDSACRSQQEDSDSVFLQDKDRSSDLAGSWDIGSAERLQDLMNLDGKIRMLKLS